MDNLKKIVAKNIITLRTANHMTQFELGERINYSDKAISRWERAEAVPDAYVLLSLGGIFGVTVDYLLSAHDETEATPPENKHPEDAHIYETPDEDKYDYGTITLISFVGVWTLALLVFVLLFTIYGRLEWIVFVYTLPVSMIVLLVFNSIWGKPPNNLYIISAFIWSVLAAIYISILMFLGYNWSIIFILGIPAQLITYLGFRIKKRK